MCQVIRNSEVCQLFFLRDRQLKLQVLSTDYWRARSLLLMPNWIVQVNVHFTYFTDVAKNCVRTVNQR